MSRWFAAALLICACGDTDEDTWVLWNDTDQDVLEVQVGATELGDAASIELHSSTGALVVGTAGVDPAAGPSGTLHTFTVQVDPTYADQVDRVSVRIDSGERGVDEYDLRQDSADEGLYVLELQSYAGEGEQRTDTVTVRLWDLSDDTDTPPVDDTAA